MLDIDPLRDGAPTVDAATVILVRDVTGAKGGIEIYMVQRHRKLAFMGGATVFPGGKVDAGDAAPEVLERVTGIDGAEAVARLAEREGATDPARALAIHVAAVRETFEESGVLLADGEGHDDLTTMRAQLNDAGLAALLEAHPSLRLRLDRLVPLSRWVTPAVEKRRFDARFFVAEVPAETVAAHDTQETIAGAWLAPDRALAMHTAGEIDLPPPTLRTLELAAHHRRASEVIAAARATRPPLVRPVFRDLSGTWVLALPGDPEHPEPGPVIDGPTRFTARDARWFSG